MPPSPAPAVVDLAERLCVFLVELMACVAAAQVKAAGLPWPLRFMVARSLRHWTADLERMRAALLARRADGVASRFLGDAAPVSAGADVPHGDGARAVEVPDGPIVADFSVSPLSPSVVACRDGGPDPWARPGVRPGARPRGRRAAGSALQPMDFRSRGEPPFV